MTREGQAEITASRRREGTEGEGESLLEKAFSLRELAKAWELSPHADCMRRRGDGSREAFIWQKMQKSGEGLRAPLRKLGILQA